MLEKRKKNKRYVIAGNIYGMLEGKKAELSIFFLPEIIPLEEPSTIEYNANALIHM